MELLNHLLGVGIQILSGNCPSRENFHGAARQAAHIRLGEHNLIKLTTRIWKNIAIRYVRVSAAKV